MSLYTPALCHTLIDDLDSIFHAAVSNSTIKSVIAEEHWELVSLFILIFYFMLYFYFFTEWFDKSCPRDMGPVWDAA